MINLIISIRGKYKLYVFIILILSTTVRFLWFSTTIERDEGTFSYVAWRFLKGDRLYAETYDLKGPITYLLYAFSFKLFGNGIHSIRLLNNMLFMFSIPVFFLIVKRWYNYQIALFSTFMFGIFMSTPIYEGHLAMTESLSLPFIIFPIFLVGVKAEGVRERSYKVLSGALMSVAFLIRQSTIAGFLLLILIIYTDKEHKKSSSVKHVSSKENIRWTLIGMAVPLLIFVLYFLLKGTFTAFLHEVFLRPLIQRGLRGGPFHYNVFPRILLIAEALPLWVFGVSGVLYSIIKHQTRNLKSLLWLLLFAVIVALPPSFNHIYLYLVPPLSIFAGILMTKLSSSKSLVPIQKKQFPSAFVLFIIFMVISAGIQSFQYPNTTIQNVPGLSNWDRYLLISDLRTYNEQISLASYMRQHSGPLDEILVYGMDPEIYWLSGYKSPTRDTWSIREELENKVIILEKLRNHEFRYVVLFERLIELYPDDIIINFVRKNYSIEKIIGLAYVYCPRE